MPEVILMPSDATGDSFDTNWHHVIDDFQQITKSDANIGLSKFFKQGPKSKSRVSYEGYPCAQN